MGNNTNAPAKVPEQKLTPVQKFETNLKMYESTIMDLLGEKYNFSPKEFMITTVNAIKKTPKLLECNPKSLFGAILLSCEMGLRPNTPEGLAYLIPYGKECQFIIGYKGLVEIAYRSDRVRSISGHPVFENDEFDMSLGTDQYIKHVPVLDGKNKGKLIGVYACAKLDGADPAFAWVDKTTLDAIQKLSPAGRSKQSPYNNGTDVHNFMQVKAAIKKLFKTLPKTGKGLESLHKAVEIDSKFEGGATAQATVDGEYEIIENEQRDKGSEKLNQALVERAEESESGNSSDESQENVEGLTGKGKGEKKEGGKDLFQG